jgi:predicted ATPase/DNA-binding XRE family transcriptional regulator
MVRARTSPFGDRLRRLREAAGLTQEELADRAGLSRDAVSALERGHRLYPHPQTIRLLADGLGLSEGGLQELQASAPKRRTGRPSPSDRQHSFPLPFPRTTLVGRHREILDLRRLVSEGGVRLVTLTGPGGVGKTRLALELASDFRSHLSSEVAFVSLESVQDPALILPTIGDALGVRDTGAGPLIERLSRVLCDRRVILILDNLEHLTEAAAPVSELLGACHGLAVLATSRATLRVSGEQEYAVLPLETPLPNRRMELDALAANDAVALFVQRARAVRPDFALNDANAAAVAEICERLDGLPLAIELAAARVKVLPPEALLARLGSGLGLLAGGPRDQATRLQSMRAAIDWSYDLLDPAERTLFRRLSVFADEFSLEAAEAVMSGMRTHDEDVTAPVPPILDGVASLVDKSLLRRIESDAEPRFGMLVTIREYGLEQVAASGESTKAREAHAAYFLDLAEQAWPVFRQRSGHESWLNRLEDERGNLRAALGWLDESNDAASLLQLTGALYWFWYIRGPLSEGRSWLERALATQAADILSVSLLRALVGAGQLAHFQGDDEQARTWLEAGLDRCQELANPWWLALTLGILGAVAEDDGDYPLAEVRFAGALEYFRAADDRANAAASLYHLGIVAWGQGDVQRAAALCEEAVALQRAVGDTWGLSNSLAYLGLLAEERDEHAHAATLHRESLELRWTSRTWEDVAGSLADLAVLAAAVERAEQAARLFGAASALVEEEGRVLKLPERAVYERAEARARLTLGEDAYAHAHSAGRALSRDLAVAEAFALADETARLHDDL